jgi:hypothetical protein
MTRRSLLNTRSNQEQSLRTVWLWHQFQDSLIGEERSRLFAALARGESPAESRYFGKTREELDADLAFQTAELSLLSMFGMLACTEAALQVDFIVRVGNREKDEVSRGFRDASKEQGGRIRLEEDILDVWREHGEARIKSAVQAFKGALNLRHWLAHGRYWKPKLGRAAGYVPADVFGICSELLQAIGLTPRDAPMQGNR